LISRILNHLLPEEHLVGAPGRSGGSGPPPPGTPNPLPELMPSVPLVHATTDKVYPAMCFPKWRLPLEESECSLEAFGRAPDG
jgi:hypothetical protein